MGPDLTTTTGLGGPLFGGVHFWGPEKLFGTCAENRGKLPLAGVGLGPDPPTQPTLLPGSLTLKKSLVVGGQPPPSSSCVIYGPKIHFPHHFLLLSDNNHPKSLPQMSLGPHWYWTNPIDQTKFKTAPFLSKSLHRTQAKINKKSTLSTKSFDQSLN